MVTIKDSERATKIIEAAETLFARKGFDGVTIREIANEAHGLSSTIYYYYQNKKGLFKAILEKTLSELTNILEVALQDRATPCERLKLYIRCYTEFLSERQKAAYIALQVVIYKSPDLKYLVNQYVARHHLILEDILRDGVETGVFRPMDIHLITSDIFGMIIWHFIFPSTADKHPEKEYHKKEYYEKKSVEIVDVILHGIIQTK